MLLPTGEYNIQEVTLSLAKKGYVGEIDTYLEYLSLSIRYRQDKCLLPRRLSPRIPEIANLGDGAFFFFHLIHQEIWRQS